MNILSQLDVKNIVAGLVLGAVVSLFISNHFYVKALNDAKADALEATREMQLVLRGIESVGNIKYSRDAQGKISGVNVELSAKAVASSSTSGAVSVIPAKND